MQPDSTLPNLTTRSADFKRLLVYAAPCLLIWGIYFLAFFPGIMSADSLRQWHEVMTFQFDDWHPAFDSFTYWVLTRLWFSPAIICIAQILALAGVFAYGMLRLEKRGLPLWGLITLTIFFSLFPLNGFYVNTLFKDVPFGIVILLLFIYSIEIVASNGAWLLAKRHVVGLAIVLALIWLVRHNGLLTSLSAIACLLICYKPYFKRTLVVLLGCLALVGLVKGPLYTAIKVNGRPYALDILLAHQIGAVLSEGTQPTASERKVLEQVLPLPLWKKNYNPYESDPIVFNKKFSYNYLATDTGRLNLIKTWATLVPRNPVALARHQKRVSELVWGLDHTGVGYTYAAHFRIDENNLGLKEESILPLVHKFLLVIYFYIIQSTPLRIVLLRPALYMYISFVFAGLSVRFTSNWRYLFVIAPLLSIVVGLILTIPAQHVRYLYPCFLLAPFLGGYLVLHLMARRNTQRSL